MKRRFFLLKRLLHLAFEHDTRDTSVILIAAHNVCSSQSSKGQQVLANFELFSPCGRPLLTEVQKQKQKCSLTIYVFVKNQL